MRKTFLLCRFQIRNKIKHQLDGRSQRLIIAILIDRNKIEKQKKRWPMSNDILAFGSSQMSLHLIKLKINVSCCFKF